MEEFSKHVFSRSKVKQKLKEKQNLVANTYSRRSLKSFTEEIFKCPVTLGRQVEC